MNRKQLINHLLAQAHWQQMELDQTMALLDVLFRAEALVQMANDWALTHPPRVPLQLMRVDSVAMH